MDSSSCGKKTLKIVEKCATTHNTFFIKLESEADLVQPKSVYHIWIYDQDGNKRPYSPIYTTKRHIGLQVKVYPEGKLSNYIASKDIGDTVCISDFLQGKEMKLNEHRNVLMIAGGTGVTPMFQTLRDHILTGLNTTDYTLLFLNYRRDDIFLENELETLKKKSNGKLQVIHILDKETETPDNLHIGGVLNKDRLLTVTRSKMFEQVYICGPPSLIESFAGPKVSPREQGELKGILKEIGYTERNVYKL